MYMYWYKENKTEKYLHVLVSGKWDRQVCTCIGTKKIRRKTIYMYWYQENETGKYLHVSVLRQ